MLKEGAQLFFGQLATVALRTRRLAALLFCALWLSCILVGMHADFLFLPVEALTLLHTTISLVACVVGPVIATQRAAQLDGPYPFGLSRLSVVVRLSACVLLVFGCVTSLVETVHKAAHHHTSHVTLPCVMAGVHLLLTVLFRPHVMTTDRVVGRQLSADPRGVASDEMSLCRDAGPVGSGHSTATERPHLFVDTTEASCVSVFQRLLAASRPHLVPCTALLSYALVSTTGRASIDVVLAVFTAALLLRDGLREGSHMLWLLLNNPIHDAPALDALDDALNYVRRTQGVTQVYSTNWWRVNACDAMLIVRVRIHATADPRAVSHAVRQPLQRIASYVYVECATSTEVFRSAPESGHHEGASAGMADSCHGHSHGHDHGHDHGCHEDVDPTATPASYAPAALPASHPLARGTTTTTTTYRPTSSVPATGAAVGATVPGPVNPYSRTITTQTTTTGTLPSTSSSRGPLPPPPSFTFNASAGAGGGNPYMNRPLSSLSSLSTPQSTPQRQPGSTLSTTPLALSGKAPPNVFTPWQPPSQQR